MMRATVQGRVAALLAQARDRFVPIDLTAIFRGLEPLPVAVAVTDQTGRRDRLGQSRQQGMGQAVIVWDCAFWPKGRAAGVLLGGHGGKLPDTVIGISIFIGATMIALVSALIGLPRAIPAWSAIFSLGRSPGPASRQTVILPAVFACCAATVPLLDDMRVIVWLAVAGFLSVIATVFTRFAYRGANWQEFA